MDHTIYSSYFTLFPVFGGHDGSDVRRVLDLDNTTRLGVISSTVAVHLQPLAMITHPKLHGLAGLKSDAGHHMPKREEEQPQWDTLTGEWPFETSQEEEYRRDDIEQKADRHSRSPILLFACLRTEKEAAMERASRPLFPTLI